MKWVGEGGGGVQKRLKIQSFATSFTLFTIRALWRTVLHVLRLLVESLKTSYSSNSWQNLSRALCQYNCLNMQVCVFQRDQLYMQWRKKRYRLTLLHLCAGTWLPSKLKACCKKQHLQLSTITLNLTSKVKRCLNNTAGAALDLGALAACKVLSPNLSY